MVDVDEELFPEEDASDLPALTSPMLDDWLTRVSMRTSEEARDSAVIETLTRIFDTIQALEACGDDEARSVWVRLPRGTYDNFLADCGEDEDAPDEQEWRETYPEESGWFRVTLTRYRGSIGLTLNTHSVTQTPGELASGRTADRPDLRLRHVLAWLEPAVTGVVDAVRAGTYNVDVAANLPYRKRLGKIRRADWWVISPVTREWHLGDFSADEADRLYQTIAERKREFWKGRQPDMTVDCFLRACQIGYQAVGAEGCETMTARELYERHADGRHDGLLDLDPTSSDAFTEWMTSGLKGGHPWEILRGGDSTHVSLHVPHDEEGWWFTVDGLSAGRSVESARIFLALVGAGLPAELADASSIAAMLIGADDIGIVPENVFLRYCQGLYPGENVSDFMHLAREHAEQVIDRAYWYPIPLVRLSETSGTGG